jgi:hypothetical protein
VISVSNLNAIRLAQVVYADSVLFVPPFPFSFFPIVPFEPHISYDFNIFMSHNPSQTYIIPKIAFKIHLSCIRIHISYLNCIFHVSYFIIQDSCFIFHVIFHVSYSYCIYHI